MTNIHSTAIVSPDAVLGKDVVIGPFCVIGDNVIIGDNTELYSNVVIDGHTTIGKNNKIFHSAVLGTAPQDLKYKGEPTKLRIGDNNVIREFVTLNRSATMDEDVVIGDNNMFMAYSHVAHNCQLGSNIILANSVNLAGHVHIDDFTIVGGLTAVHQFVHIGKYTFVGGASGVKKDVPPYTRGEGMPYKVAGLNTVGLQRRGFTETQIANIKKIYKIFFQSGLNVSQAKERAKATLELTSEIAEFFNFVQNSTRGLVKSGRSR